MEQLEVEVRGWLQAVSLTPTCHDAYPSFCPAGQQRTGAQTGKTLRAGERPGNQPTQPSGQPAEKGDGSEQQRRPWSTQPTTEHHHRPIDRPLRPLPCVSLSHAYAPLPDTILPLPGTHSTTTGRKEVLNIQALLQTLIASASSLSDLLRNCQTRLVSEFLRIT